MPSHRRMENNPGRSESDHQSSQCSPFGYYAGLKMASRRRRVSGRNMEALPLRAHHSSRRVIKRWSPVLATVDQRWSPILATVAPILATVDQRWSPVLAPSAGPLSLRPALVPVLVRSAVSPRRKQLCAGEKTVSSRRSRKTRFFPSQLETKLPKTIPLRNSFR
jgi:hypothetical protein